MRKMLALRRGHAPCPIPPLGNPCEEYLQVSKLWKCERVRLNARNLIVRQGQSLQMEQVARKHAQM